MSAIFPFMNSTQSTTVAPTTFENDARRALDQMRGAFAALLESLPVPVTLPHEVSKKLGIHRKLGWQIARLVYEPDPLAAAQHVPGSASIKKFLDAMSKQNVNPELLRSAEAAVNDFDRLIDVHAGDREALDLMLTGCGGEAASKAVIAQRRTAYMAGSFIWGVQARTTLTSVFLAPSPVNKGFFDGARIKGFLGLRRLRANISWPISYSVISTDDLTQLDQPTRESLDDVIDENRVAPLLRRFCSQPPPETRTRELGDGDLVYELVPTLTGKTGEIDCFIGEVVRSLSPIYRTEHDQFWAVSCRVRTPCESLIIDQFIHEDLFGPIKPELSLYGDLRVGPLPPEPLRTGDRMPIFETVQRLGKGLSGIRTPDVPRYSEMAAYVFKRLGWDPTRFDLYRARMEYPPLPTTVAVEHPLSEAPQP
jgi:hypothetical protein